DPGGNRVGEEQAQPIARARAALEGGVERGRDPVLADAVELREQIALRREVIEEGLPCDVGALAEVGDLGRVEADLAEQLDGGLEDPRARLLFAAVETGSRSRFTGHRGQL